MGRAAMSSLEAPPSMASRMSCMGPKPTDRRLRGSNRGRTIHAVRMHAGQAGPMLWQRRLAIAVTGLFLIGGCSGNGGEEGGATTTTTESTPGPSLEEWQAQTTAVCEEYEPQQDAIVAAHGEATSLDDVV